MALTTESSNRVWQKAATFLEFANPATKEAFLRLKIYLASQKKNIDLQYVPFTAEQAVTNLGTSLVGGACTIYAFYAKGRRTTGTTSAFLALHDASDNSATTTTLFTSRFKVTGEAHQLIDPIGQVVATDVVVSCATAVGGATESSAADAADGFIIVGA